MEDYKRLQPFGKGLFTGLVKPKRKRTKPYFEPQEKIDFLTKLFDEFNCDYLGFPKYDKKGDMRFRCVRFRDCGHEQDVTHHNTIRAIKSGPVCEVCRQAKKQALFDKHNFVLIEEITKDKFLVQKPCGHVSYAYSHIMKRSDKIACRECLHEQHLEACSRVGVTYLKPNENASRAIYSFNCCGLEKDLTKVAVNRGNVVCPNCGEGWMGKPSSLYLLKIQTTDNWSFLKFGYGKDIKNRIAEYRLKSCAKVDILYSVKIESGFTARKLEEGIHKECGERLNSVLMRKYMPGGGYSECYSVDKLSLILSKIQKLEMELR
jgi:hypothetical protein